MNWANPTEQRRRDAQNMHHADTHEKVFLNGSVGAPRNRPRRRDLRQIVGHQHDVRRFQRGLRAATAHCDANIGLGQRRRVVDAVAHHGHAVALGLQFGNRCDLVFGHQLCTHLVDAQLVGNDFRGEYMVEYR